MNLFFAPVNRRRSLPAALLEASLLALMVLLPAARIRGQDEEPREPLFRSRGVFGAVDAAMRRLVRFEWEGNRIRLSRIWEAPQEETAEDGAGVAPGPMIPDGDGQRPFPDVDARRRFFRRLDPSYPPVAQLFFAVSQDLPEHQGRSFSYGGESMSATFKAASLDGSMRIQGQKIVLSFRDEGRSERTVRLKDDGEGGLSLSVIDDRLVFDFRQQPGGHCRLAVLHHEVRQFEADDFESLVRQHPEAVRVFLQPVLAALGFSPPPFRDTPEVMAAVIALIKVDQMDADDRFERLISDLDDASFETRNQASEALAREFPQWRDRIKSRLLHRDVLSPEVIQRLEYITRNQEERTSVFEFIQRHQLASSVEYLVWLLERVPTDQRKAVLERLRSLTGVQLGDDPGAWQKWLEESGRAGGN